jgi:HPt (histidine-containing phosphotransfer) domain-containing protein
MLTVFDQAHFDHMTAGDRALQAEVAALFRAQADVLRAACAGADWRTAVHTLKGSARGIGLIALANACEEAEASGDEAARERVADALREALSALTVA